jgi:hypothetical protein
MIEFFSTEGGQAALLSGVVTFAAVLARHWLQGTVRLIAFSPNSSFFEFAPPDPSVPPITIRSSQVMVKNVGRLPAENVEIISESTGNPAGYNLLPAVDFEVGATNTGRWLVKIPYIAPKEMITLQILNGANIEQVRCKGGVAKFVPIIHQRLYPAWANVIAGGLMIFGVFSVFYWLSLALL